MDDFLIRLATKEDISDVLCLMRACFGERESINRTWYEWFNFTCPTGFNRNYVAIDKATGRLAGGYGLLPIKVKVNGLLVDGWWCTNVMTHPEYQQRGLFTQMGRYCLSAEESFRSRLSLGVPNQNAYPGHMRVGWKMVSDLEFVAKFSFRNSPCLSKEVSAFDARVDGMLGQVGEHTNFMVSKDHHFLNWRYPQRPDKKYRLFVFEDANDVSGYMILKYFDDNGYRKTHILDIMACSEEAFDDLILAAERCALGRDELNCWQVTPSIYKGLFAHNGFVPTGRKDVLIAHTNYGQDLEPEPSDWWFALGDNDVY